MLDATANDDKCGFLNPILGKLGVMHDLDWWLVGKLMVDFLFALIELFRCLLRFRSYESKCAQLGCFYRGRPLCTKILPGHCRRPSTILGIRKLETLRYAMMKAASLCVPSL